MSDPTQIKPEVHEEVRATAEREIPAAVIEAEVLRLGYDAFDSKSFLMGFCLGRTGPPLTAQSIRFHAEVFLSGRDRNAHLPRPGDA